MNLKTGINIHNKFEIEVRDAITGELKKKATAYNIVLNGMWTQLVNFSAYFTNILFGTGTGALSASRTTLFSFLGYKAAADDTLIKAIPVSSWKRKIVLNPEEYVGSTITEVGISNTTSTILTHALLKDSEGNPISITKTALDVVTIYATVYVTFSTQDSNQLKFTGMPSNNPLVNWLIGGAVFPTQYFYLGENDRAVNNTDMSVQVKGMLGTSGSVAIANWVKDVANKKASTPAMRFATTAGNGNIMEIGFGASQILAMFRSLLPIGSAFNGQPYTGVSIGVGDGVTKDFILPSKNINQDSITIKVNGVATSALSKSLISNVINFAFYADTTSPSSIAYDCELSANGLVLAVAHYLSPYITVYDLVGGTWIKRANPSILPSNDGLACALSADGSVLAVATNSSPYVLTYDWVGGAWIKRGDPAILPNNGRGCALSSDGLILAVAHTGNPYITVYDWSEGSWVKRSNPATLPTSPGNCCELSDDGLVLAVGHTGSPFITTYDWSGGAWIKRANPAVLPPGNCLGCALSSDGSVLAIVSDTTPFVAAYDWSGGAWTKRATPAVIPTGQGSGCALSADGLILVVATYGSPYVLVYDWVGGAWIKRPDPITTPTSRGSGCAITPDGSIASITSSNNTNPAIAIYDMKKRQTKITFDVAPAIGAAITSDYTTLGIHKTDQYVIDLSFSLQFGEVV